MTFIAATITAFRELDYREGAWRTIDGIYCYSFSLTSIKAVYGLSRHNCEGTTCGDWYNVVCGAVQLPIQRDVRHTHPRSALGQCRHHEGGLGWELVR